MTNCRTYTRVYSPGSAGQLESGKGPRGPPLTAANLEAEYRNHVRKWNRVPTALVSVSDRIVDTVRYAFEKYYIDKERPGDIWIAFIQVPDDPHIQPLWARLLAEGINHDNPTILTHEFLFEWAIPRKYVSHQVSLQTLMARGLDRRPFIRQNKAGKRWLLPTRDVQDRIAKKFPRDRWELDPWETGLEAGFFARAFGTGAPGSWIAHQYFYDCARPHERDEDVVDLRLAGGRLETVDYSFFCEIDAGIKTVIDDWSLTTSDFEWEHANFERRRDQLRDRLVCFDDRTADE